MFNHILFASPDYFYLLLLIPAIVVWYVFRFRRSQPSLRVSSTLPFAKISRGNKTWLYHGLFVLRMLALVLIIIALARPQSTSSHNDVSVEGIDIVIARIYREVCWHRTLHLTELKQPKKLGSTL